MTRLVNAFLAGVEEHGSRPALHDGGESVSYTGPALRARRLAHVLPPASTAPPLGAIVATRDLHAYASILRLLWSGRGYVPIDPRFPVRWNAARLAAAGPDVVVVESGLQPMLPALLAELARPVTVVIVDGPPESRRAYAPHATVTCNLATGILAGCDPPPSAGDIAYLLFTSGTTDAPKGIAVTHAAVCDYLSTVRARFGLTTPGPGFASVRSDLRSERT